MKIERIVITGGRSFTDGARIEADLRALLPLGLRRVAVSSPKAFILRIDTQRRESHGRSSDGGWANLEMIDAEPRFLISTFDNRGVAEQLEEVLGGAA